MDLDYHIGVIPHHAFTDEDRRRESIRRARRVAAMWGYTGRVSFARYPLRGPGLGSNAIEIRIHPKRSTP